MFTLFNSEKIWIGTDLSRLSQIRETLAGAGIEYKVKTNSHLGESLSLGGSRRSHSGSLGIPSNQMYHYEVIVYSQDFEKAKYLISAH